MNALESLSEYCGIVGSFVDARGETQTTTEKTQLALLAAMGIDATDERSARQALNDLRRQDADQAIPPVHVHVEGAGVIELPINCDSNSRAMHWRIDLEAGGGRRGEVPRATGGATQRQRVLRIEAELPCGYHTLTLEPGGASCALIVTPGQCWLPEGLESGRRLWGVAIQLYLLRSHTNWGIGDYGDLKRLIHTLSARGADVVGLNPLHAMFPDDPEQASPYSPATRLLLNVWNIDVAALADSIRCEAARAQIESHSFQQILEQCQAAQQLDYSAVAKLKLPVLQSLYECSDRTAPEWASFVAFRAAAGDTFERHCVFLALRRRFADDSSSTADWHGWPAEYRTADSPGVGEFARVEADAVTFQAWLQYIADAQLQACRDATSAMQVGLYRDLAVGANSGGAETWANPAAVVDSVTVGAPPDIYNPKGQDWGLPPFNPRTLRAEGYRSFIELVRANMRHAGGLRIDHVMALQQLYWVPNGHSPREGAYVRYPLDDLVGIVALESQRQRCLVVGEDLGTVPDGFRQRMERARILSYRVLFFEKDADGFIAPEEYPSLALAVAGSHDLPTLRAWWRGNDVKLKAELGLYPTQALAAQAAEERSADRAALEHVLRQRSFIGVAKLDEDNFVEAAHEFLGSTHSILKMLQIDDLTGELEPVNVPSTSDEHPNWRRRLSVSLEHLMTNARFMSATAAMAAHCESPPPQPP